MKPLRSLQNEEFARSPLRWPLKGHLMPLDKRLEVQPPYTPEFGQSFRFSPASWQKVRQRSALIALVEALLVLVPCHASFFPKQGRCCTLLSHKTGNMWAAAPMAQTRAFRGHPFSRHRFWDSSDPEPPETLDSYPKVSSLPPAFLVSITKHRLFFLQS